MMCMSSLPSRILLAEDNPADIFIVREALQQERIECHLDVISDGEEAIHTIDQLDLDEKTPCPDLLLLDLHLPRRGGEEIIRRLRASGRCRQTPVIVLTASESPRDRETAERNAVLHYFKKSPNIEAYMRLGPLVKNVLSRSAGGEVE
jgi:CheY-like chemotaxis protein